MSREFEEDEWHTTTDRQRIVAWADRRGAVPVGIDRSGGGATVDVVTDPDDSLGEPIDWETFFERFENEGLVFRHRESTGSADDGRTCEVLPLEALDDREAVDEKTAPPPDEVESDQVAVSDTGEGEPVIFDRVEGEADEAPEADAQHGHRRVADDTPNEDTDGDTAMAESARAAEEQAIVLDEAYEAPGGFASDPEEEYLVFENTSEQPVDLGGWVVENDDGRTYVFPTEFVLDPGARVTLHSGKGVDEDADLHWGAEKSIWDPTGDTVELRTPAGTRVVYEPIQGG